VAALHGRERCILCLEVISAQRIPGAARSVSSHSTLYYAVDGSRACYAASFGLVVRLLRAAWPLLPAAAIPEPTSQPAPPSAGGTTPGASAEEAETEINKGAIALRLLADTLAECLKQEVFCHGLPRCCVFFSSLLTRRLSPIILDPVLPRFSLDAHVLCARSTSAQDFIEDLLADAALVLWSHIRGFRSGPGICLSWRRHFHFGLSCASLVQHQHITVQNALSPPHRAASVHASGGSGPPLPLPLPLPRSLVIDALRTALTAFARPPPHRRDPHAHAEAARLFCALRLEDEESAGEREIVLVLRVQQALGSILLNGERAQQPEGGEGSEGEGGAVSLPPDRIAALVGKTDAEQAAQRGRGYRECIEVAHPGGRKV